MQGNWSAYYHGQTPPRASTSGSESLQPAAHISSDQQQQHQKPSIPQSQISTSYSYVAPPYLPQVYYPEASNSSMLHPIRTSTSSSISSSSMSGPMSPLSMRASMSSSATGVTPTTPMSLHSPSYIKDGMLGDSWFGSLQDQYLSSDGQLNADGSRPALYRMQRMSISSPMQSSPQVNSWSPPGNPPQTENTTPRRASVATFQPFSSSSHLSSVPELQQSSYVSQSHPQQQQQQQHQQYYSYTANPLLPSQPPIWQTQQGPLSPTTALAPIQTNHTYFGAPSSMYTQGSPNHAYAAESGAMDLYRSQSGYTAQPSHQAWQGSAEPESATSDNYNFAGVLLQREDLHLLGPDPLSSSTMYADPSFRPAQTGWQPSFSFTGPSSTAPATVAANPAVVAGDSTPKAVQQSTMQSPSYMYASLSPSSQQPHWNFASFHGFTPLQALPTSQPLAERAVSAPPVEPVAEAPSVAVRPVAMHRRRGSSVDSPIFASTFNVGAVDLTPHSPPRVRKSMHMTSPVYLGRGPVRVAQSSLAARRATVGPNPLDLNKPPTVLVSPAAHSASVDLATPPKSAPLPATSGPRSPGSASPTRRPRGRRSMAPMFINFTGKDAKKLLSGVAPSGSSKRKREEEEQLRLSVKHVKSRQGSEMPSSDQDPQE